MCVALKQPALCHHAWEGLSVLGEGGNGELRGAAHKLGAFSEPLILAAPVNTLSEWMGLRGDTD